MNSVTEVDKEGLSSFLSYQLLPFLSDGETPTDNISGDTPTDNIPIDTAGPSHLTEEELDDLFSNAFEELDEVSSYLEVSEACSNKNASSVTTKPISAKSNPSHSSKTIRKFAQPVSSEDIAKSMQSAIPKKTQYDTKYCYALWEDWILQRRKSTGEMIPSLCSISVEELQYWLCPFILEVRKRDGNVFVPNTLHHICCGIMRYLRTNGMPGIDIFKDPSFSQFRMVLDAEMKRLQSAGIGVVHQKAEPITFEEEEILWQKKILGDHTPESLVNTMVYMNGLYFALRGGSEHRNLRHKPSQIQLIEKPGERPYLLYTEDVSKNHPGGLKGRKIKPKIVCHHANVSNPKRCFVRLYKLYNSHCPPNRPDNAYYLRPVKSPAGEDFWYTTQPLGHCTLDTTIKRMCKQAGIPGYHTNHSLRATTATRLHQSGCVEEQEIMERTGHRSNEAVRSYKRTSREQLEQVSDILNNDHNTKKICYSNTLSHIEFNNSQALSLECSRSAVTPVFNISSCSSVTINYSAK